MGKKTRKTRWRTLTITDEPSDSEESSTTTAQRLPKGYYQKSYYNKFPYSSQSTPRRRFQHDGTNSTRSSSTASENKITFNEDEYTRITTPRQDVLFKKGYLNKPKNYQTQTSTGTSTTSTGNSTGNGTPDHQSTDLEYESQFVFPNGFVDQNGIYYVNGYESYPLMLYNPPTYYPEFSNRKSKRYSTGSLTESMSPNNEEATSQDLSGGEANNVSDYSGHHAVYNMIYPGYYVNDVCPPHDVMNGQSSDQTRRIKKRRHRKTSKSQTAQDSSEYTDDESDSGDEEKPKVHPIPKETLQNCHTTEEITKVVIDEKEVKPSDTDVKENPKSETEEAKSSTPNEVEKETDPEAANLNEIDDSTSAEAANLNERDDSTSAEAEEQKEDSSCLKEDRSSPEESTSESTKNPETEEIPENPSSACTKSNLKPDAEEFIPRAYRGSETPISSNPPFIKVPPNFVPIPVIPLGEFNGQNFSPAFIPPGIPINFLPPDPKLFPNFVGFVSNNFLPKNDSATEDNKSTYEENVSNQTDKKETCDNLNTAKDDNIRQNQEPVEKPVVQNNKTIDIATIVSKLEEAAKEQEDQDAKKTQHDETQTSPRRKFPENKYSKVGQKYKNYRRNYYNSPQTSPQKKNYYTNGNVNGIYKDAKEDDKSNTHSQETEQKSEEKHEICKYPSTNLSNGTVIRETVEVTHEFQKQPKSSPEKIKKNWKYQHFQNGSPNKWHQNNTNKDLRYRQNGKIYTENDTKDYKPKQSYKNYSEMLMNNNQAVELKTPEECNVENQKLVHSKNETVESPKATSPVKKPNQWISVSNRKKRKNKNTEETDTTIDVQVEEEKEEHSNAELFESYDVSLLVDVIPTSVENEVITIEKIEVSQNVEKEIIDNVTETEPSSIFEGRDEFPDVSDISVSDTQIENVEIDIPKEPVQSDVTADLPDTSVNEIATREIVIDKIVIDEIFTDELPEFNPIPLQVEASEKSKKKSKKGTQKPLTKRVIITDLDLSMNSEQLRTPIKKVVTKLDTKIVPKTEEKQDTPIPEPSAIETPSCNEEEKRKSKKKKKKPSKLPSVSSLSSSNATINIIDDSYDFLLDSALSDESVEKTNIEVSQELDKLIQRGMYSCLEEKIKLMNIDEGDGFFKSIFSTITSREPSVEKTGFAQSSDLSKILQNTRKPCSSSSVSQENNSQNKDINTVLPNLDSPDEDGLFLKSPDLNEILQDQTVTNDADNEVAKPEEPNRDCEPISEDTNVTTDAETKSYPITQAVKEWMNKSRENTPDVVLLKSPSDIYKEFCDSASESDTEVTDSKNLSSSDDLTTAIGDEEVTIFTNEIRTDSMNLVGICEAPNEHSENKTLIGNVDQDRYIEEGEDVVEVYDSKFGKNDDFLQIQKEIRETVNTSNHPKHRNTPYRAICCSIV